MEELARTEPDQAYSELGTEPLPNTSADKEEGYPGPGRPAGVQEAAVVPAPSGNAQGWRCRSSFEEPERARTRQLERSLQKSREENSSLRKRYHQLYQAFRFNLGILDDQDEELKTYDSVIAQALTVEHNRKLHEEIQKRVKKCDQMKLELQHKIHNFVGELARQKEMKLLSKESDIHQMIVHTTKRFCQKLQAQLQQAHDEMLNRTTVTDSRMKKLEEELDFMKIRLKRKEHQVKKFRDVLPALEMRNAHLSSECQAQTEKLHKAEEQIVGLKKAVDVLAAQTQHVQETQQQADQQRDKELQRIFTELQETQTNWEKCSAETSREMVVKNREVITLQERASTLRAELQRSREHMESYKQQLMAGLRRESNLEQLRVQTELEWQRRFEDLKADLCLNNEQLIQDLIQARDQAQAELRVKDQELKELTVMVHSAQAQMGQAVQGVTPKVDPLTTREILRLQEQNNSLRAVISQMRVEMQTLSLHLHGKVEASFPQPPQLSSDKVASHSAQTQTAPATPAMTRDPDLMKQNVETQTCTCGDTAPAPDSKQGSQLRQIQEDTFHLQKQVKHLVSSLRLDRGTKRKAPLLQSRLKQAVSCIVRLSREKQQLIEMGNRLRAQTTAYGPQDPVEPEEEESVEEPGVQKNRLSALEQLQYQLTTQELEYALKQRGCTVAEHLQEHLCPVVPAIHVQSPKKSDGPLHRSLSESSHADVSYCHLSSEESGRSLKELWDVLDHGLSLSTFSEDEGEQSRKQPAESIHPVILNPGRGQLWAQRKGNAVPKARSNISRTGQLEAVRRRSRVEPT